MTLNNWKGSVFLIEPFFLEEASHFLISSLLSVSGRIAVGASLAVCLLNVIKRISSWISIWRYQACQRAEGPQFLPETGRNSGLPIQFGHPVRMSTTTTIIRISISSVRSCVFLTWGFNPGVKEKGPV